MKMSVVAIGRFTKDWASRETLWGAFYTLYLYFSWAQRISSGSLQISAIVNDKKENRFQQREGALGSGKSVGSGVTETEIQTLSAYELCKLRFVT